MILTKEWADRIKQRDIKINYINIDAELKDKKPEIEKVYNTNGEIIKITFRHCEKMSTLLSKIGNILTFQCSVCSKQFALIFKGKE